MHRPNFTVVLAFASGLAIAVTTSATATHPIAYSKTEVEAQVTAAEYPAYSATITALGASVETLLKGAAKTRPVSLRVEQIYAGRGMKVGDVAIRDYPVPPSKEEIAAQASTPPRMVTAGGRTVVVAPFDEGPIEDVAWQGVTPRLGEKLLILERGGERRILSAEPATSPVAAKIRELIQLNQQMKRNPQAILDRAAAMRPNAEPVETVYLTEAPIFRDTPRLGVATYLLLLRKDGFTSEQRSTIAFNFGLLWIECPSEVKASSLEQIMRLAAVPDYESARPMVGLLLMLRSHDALVELPQLKPVVGRQLMANYERFVASGNRRDPALEARLNRMAGAK